MDLDELLQPDPLVQQDPILREQLGKRTLREVRWQRRRRRLTAIASLVGAYAAGVLTVLAIRPPELSAPTSIRHPLVVQVKESLVDLECRALEQPEKAQQLYKTAGDRYLAEDDPANAARCYGNSVGAAPEDTQLNPDDNWLLMAIKLSRRKDIQE